MPSTLEVTTPSDREVPVTRTFDAPPDLVFECHTKPKLVQKWLLGPPGWTMPVCEIDLRPGGRYRYVWRSEQKNFEFGMQGEFLEVDAPHRIVHVGTMDGEPGDCHITNTFAASGNGTLFTVTMRYQSRELRDAALKTGMTDGMGMSYDRLDGVAVEARA